MRGRNDFLRNRTPAPADYRPEVGAKKRAPGYSFGTTSRPRVFGPTDFDSPGPGEYFHSSKFSNQQKGFSFGLRVRKVHVSVSKQLIFCICVVSNAYQVITQIYLC